MISALSLHGTSVLLAATESDAVRTAADRVLSAIDAAVCDRGRADIALSAGDTAELVYASLSAREPQPDWSKVGIWQTDESFVASTDPRSHGARIRHSLLSGGLPIPAENFHFFPVDEVLRGGGDAAACAQRYGELLASRSQQEFRRPHFDLLVAELSPMASVLSIFPESPAFDPVVGHLVPATPPAWTGERAARMTLTAKCFDLASKIIVLATGPGRARAVSNSLVSVREPRNTSAQLLVRNSATWILDEAAATSIALALSA